MEISQAAAQLEALGNTTRLSIFRILVQAGGQGVPVGQVQKRLDIPASTLSHHIAKLVQAGVVVQRRESRTLYCQADYQAMQKLIGFMVDKCCADEGC